MNSDKLGQLRIEPEQKRRPRRAMWIILVSVLIVTAVAVFFAVPRASDSIRVWQGKDGAKLEAAAGVADGTSPAKSSVRGAAPATNTPAVGAREDDSVLTTTGYIVNRERVELSPRFMGIVKWIGVKKGDSVTNGQTVVLLDDAEYRARLREIDGRMAVARVAVDKAKLDYDRAGRLAKANIESQQLADDARLALESAQATITEIEGGRSVIQTYIDWCVIKSPIDGVVLEKLVDPNELVVPQSFGGGRGPSTALIALADPKDLQVEIDLNEADLAKVKLNQKCRVSPEAYPDKVYAGYVAEIAPEANRQKGTLQIKVQIREPDRFLTPELTARVDFLKE
jgi:HlyD family secretion protein